MVASHAEGCRVDSRLRLYRFILCTRRTGGYPPLRVGGVTSQLDLQSLTPLSEAMRVGIFGLIGCISLSLSLALPTFFNNNNNNNGEVNSSTWF